MNTINFTANFVKRAPVLKKDDKGDYSPAKVTIVELDIEDENDILALYKTSVEWNELGALYASEVFHEAVKGYEYGDIEKEHYFAVTEQTKDFHKLDSDKILGLMLFSESRYNEDEINWLQIKPNTNSVNSHNREYKHIGKSLVDLLKERYWHKSIYVKSSSAAVDFYTSQGFQPNSKDAPACMHLEV